MFQLTPKIKQHLGQSQKRSFVSRLLEEMRETWGEECQVIGEEQLPKFVNALVDRALAYGLEAEYDVARYVAVAFALRRGGYDQLPWAAEILNDASLPARVRMNRVWRTTRQIYVSRAAAEEQNV